MILTFFGFTLYFDFFILFQSAFKLAFNFKNISLLYKFQTILKQSHKNIVRGNCY